MFVWETPGIAYSSPGFVPPSREEIEREGQRLIAATIDRIDTHGVSVVRQVIEGSPSRALAGEAGQPDVAMVVVGARGHGGLVGLLLGSISHALTHECSKPLVVVPSGWPRSEAADLADHIVVGVDGSPEAERALRWAVAEAAARGGTVEAVTAWSLPSPVMPFHLPISGVAGETTLTRVRALLDEAVDKVDPGPVPVERIVEQGPPDRVLSERAATGQLLVVGRRGLGRAREALLGSVSHSCTHHPSVPVAVIPDFD
jgi:nucleotide-binding universal stress UspA family protein